MYLEDVALFFTLVCHELPRLCTLKMQRCYLLFCCLLFYFTVLCLGVCLEEELFFTVICLPLPSCVPWRCCSVLYYVLNYPVVCPEDTALFFIICLQLPSCVPWRCSSVLYYDMCWIAHLCTLKRQCCSLLCLELLVVYPEETVLFFTMSWIPQLCTLKM